MLVLSIAVVAVTMSFSAASKTNLTSRKKQSIESLMENLMEYAESGGKNYKDWFFVNDENYDSETDATDTDKFIEKLSNVSQGLYKYDIRITTDSSPDEYNKEKLNDFKVIQFGGTNSGTVLIDASLKSADYEPVPVTDGVADYDTEAYDFFYYQHMLAVAASIEAGEVPPLTETPRSDIPDFVDRELRLEVTKPTADKMQLTAYMTYILDDSISLPTGVGHELNAVTLFESKIFDLPTDTDADAKKLTQVYIMYSPATEEPTVIGENQDIRILDPNHVMDADIFIAKQQESLTSLSTAIGQDSVAALDGTSYTVRVSFRKPDSTTEYYNPAGGDIYCSGNVELQDPTMFSTTCHDDDLIAKGDEVRIVTTTLEILESGTNTVLASKKVTHLQ